MRQTLKARIKDGLLVVTVILAVAIGVVLEAPITEAFRVAMTPVQAEQASHSERVILTGTASVIDGDTLEIRSHRIRLHGIDAPESGQACTDADGQRYNCGQRAALALSERIGRRPVRCEQTEMDRYGRVVAVCMLGTLDLNGWMVRMGHAVAYRRYSTDYLGEEALARADGRGVWTGRFVMPRDWRRGERL